MVEESRRQRQRRLLVNDILDEARSQLEDGGPSSVSLRGIGRAVGMSAPSLYTYFPSLADLFTELIVESFESLAAAVAAALDEVSDQPLDVRLRAGPRAYRQWALAHRQQFNLVFFDQISGYEAPPEGRTVEAQTAVLQPMSMHYAEAREIAESDLTSQGPALDGFLAWWGAFHGLVALEANHHLDWVDPDRLFEERLDRDIDQILNVPQSN